MGPVEQVIEFDLLCVCKGMDGDGGIGVFLCKVVVVGVEAGCNICIKVWEEET